MTSENGTTFTTTFGRSIEYVPGHIELVKKTIGLLELASSDWKNANINAAGGHENLNYKEINAELGSSRATIHMGGYATRLTRTYQFLSLLRNTGVRYPFQTSLDIGCGFATQPRILKALGIVEEAVGIDVYDRASAVDESHLSRQHRQFRRRRVLDSNHGTADGPSANARTGIRRVLQDLFPDPRTETKIGTGWMPDIGVFKLKFVNRPRLDRYINGDVFDLQERFDLVTSFSSLEWFESRSIFRKISELLEPNGVFYLWVPNWWCAVNTTTLAGHFPYACQRLTKEDYFRYLDESFPEQAEAMKVAYNYFDPGHPTLSDYLDIGYENGLVALDWKSNIIPEMANKKRGITSLGYFLNDRAGITDVLDDIHRFRPDVRLSDLLAHTHSIVFKKMDQAGQIDGIDPEKFLPDTAPPRRGSFPTRVVRKIARTMLGPVFGR